MGYRCPVCETPQADGEHLANHLAFTALLHGDEHEGWLDEHAPGWSEGGAADLVPHVTDRAEEIEFETVFEDTTDDHDHAGSLEDALAEGTGRGRAPLDDEAEGIIEEAREMTERMCEGGEDEEAEGEEDRPG